ncbi:MAG TPA: OmpA family protein [Sulfurimonas autotrophica]|nr:OmpA family protein [Sulfurimonas autotrophica]
MHYLIKKNYLIIFGLLLTVSLTSVSADNLYSCQFEGKKVTYHENDARRMLTLGAECYKMTKEEYVTCSMKGVRLTYSFSEAEMLLLKYPDAMCEMNDKLRYGKSSKNGLVLKSQIVIYFSVNGKVFSKKSRAKILKFAKLHKNMGYVYTITGYASSPGGAAYNHTLSLKRAGRVNDTLISGGVNKVNILSVDAMGEESLRYKTKHEEQRNRAVVIKAFVNS